MTESNQKIANKPTEPCNNCHSTDWWYRDNGLGKPEWLCGKCHPNPQENKE